ncbi:uncharacterized protein [Nicotiana tomentosiformis]|uniref:uncharacterized protein n=1 Tax=Nicotiana tomentosiformis TaxID=4098 RepID=UPI00388CBA41
MTIHKPRHNFRESINNEDKEQVPAIDAPAQAPHVPIVILGLQEARTQILTAYTGLAQAVIQGLQAPVAPPAQPVIVAQDYVVPAMPEDDQRMLERFGRFQPLPFSGTEREDAQDFLDRYQRILRTVGILETCGVSFTTFQFSGAALRLWEAYERRRPVCAATLTWQQFSVVFLKKLVPRSRRNELHRQFVRLRQGNMSLMQYEMRFSDLARHAIWLVPMDRERMMSFIDGLTYQLQLLMTREQHGRGRHFRQAQSAQPFHRGGSSGHGSHSSHQGHSSLSALLVQSSFRAPPIQGSSMPGSSTSHPGARIPFSFCRQQQGVILSVGSLGICGGSVLVVMEVVLAQDTPATSRAGMRYSYPCRPYSRVDSGGTSDTGGTTIPASCICSDPVWLVPTEREKIRRFINGLNQQFHFVMTLENVAGAKFDEVVDEDQEAQRMVGKVCLTYLAFVRDVDADTPTIDSVPVVQNFPDVFPVDLSGIPPDRNIDFGFSLVPDTRLISIPLYRMAPAELRN